MHCIWQGGRTCRFIPTKLLIRHLFDFPLHTHTNTHTVPSFLTKPKDAIVPFNLSANVTFFCAIDGNEIIWEVNNAQLDSERRRNDAEACEIYVEDESPSPDRNSSMLLITVREDNDNNGTTVVCIAEEDSVFDRVRSELVTIRTYGK